VCKQVRRESNHRRRYKRRRSPSRPLLCRPVSRVRSPAPLTAPACSATRAFLFTITEQGGAAKPSTTPSRHRLWKGELDISGCGARCPDARRRIRDYGGSCRRLARATSTQRETLKSRAVARRVVPPARPCSSRARAQFKTRRRRARVMAGHVQQAAARWAKGRVRSGAWRLVQLGGVG
jgi:hypothetical protein